MKVALLVGSSRIDGNSAQVSDFLLSKLEAESIFLGEKEIGFFSYSNDNAADDFIPMINELSTYDIWIFITPVYWYSMSAQMKTFMDRLSDLLKWEKDLAIAIQKSSWYIISCGSEGTEVPGFFNPFRLSAEYLGINYLGDCHVWKDNRQPFTYDVVSTLHQVVGTLTDASKDNLN